MVKIRLARSGTKKKPYYRVVVADQRCKRDGRYLEHIGFYNPMVSENRFGIDEDESSTGFPWVHNRRNESAN